jgi:hypothetical protein
MAKDSIRMFEYKVSLIAIQGLDCRNFLTTIFTFKVFMVERAGPEDE